MEKAGAMLRAKADGAAAADRDRPHGPGSSLLFSLLHFSYLSIEAYCAGIVN